MSSLLYITKRYAYSNINRFGTYATKYSEVDIYEIRLGISKYIGKGNLYGGDCLFIRRVSDALLLSGSCRQGVARGLTIDL